MSKFKNKYSGPRIRVNNYIRAYRVRVIDSKTNEQLGVMDTDTAIKKAKGLGLDLVEVAPNAKPPVCKIIDFGKYKYSLAKQEKEKSKTKNVKKTKEVKFHVNTEEHDHLMKMRKCEKFLQDGCVLKVQLVFRGRELAHREIGFEKMNAIKENLKSMGNIDSQPKAVGKYNISMMVTPLPKNQQSPKYLDNKKPETKN